MRSKHTDRPGFWFGLIDFCTAGLFFLFYMPLDGLGIEGPYTSWWHMFGWNTFGVLFLGPAIVTKRSSKYRIWCGNMGMHPRFRFPGRAIVA